MNKHASSDLKEEFEELSPKFFFERKNDPDWIEETAKEFSKFLKKVEACHAKFDSKKGVKLFTDESALDANCYFGLVDFRDLHGDIYVYVMPDADMAEWIDDRDLSSVDGGREFRFTENGGHGYENFIEYTRNLILENRKDNCQ